MYLLVMILLCLLLIMFQDLRYRAVYWICFPILAGLLFYDKQRYIGMQDTLIDAGYNSVFFGLQLLLLWIYFFMKQQEPVNIFKQHLGLGDVLFLLAVGFYFSPLNYVLFYIVSLTLVLVYALVQLYLFKRRKLQIPLAGLQAIFLMPVLVLSEINRDFNFNSDFWIWKLIPHF